MALIPRKYMEKFDEENTHKTENTSIQPDQNKSDENEKMDGREKEWQDRGRVQLEKPDPKVKTNIERDFEPRESDTSEEDKPTDPAY